MKKLDKFFITTFVASLIMLSVIAGVKQLRAADSNETTSTTLQGGVQQQQLQQQQQPNEQERIVSPPNHPPNANAGSDKKVNEGSTVNLDARRSSDPDTGNKITYSWKQLAGRLLVDLGLSADGSTTSFAAPSVDRDTVLTFAVTVTDEKGAQDRDSVKVLVNNVETSVPILETTNSNNPLDNTTANALSNAQLSDRNNNGNINNNRTGAQTITPQNTQLSRMSVITPQAITTGVSSVQSNNIVNTRTVHDIIFRTASAGTIGRFEVTFPAGTGIGGGNTLEISGLGLGSTSKNGQTLIYTVTSPVNVPAGVYIRLEVWNIINPPSLGSLTVQVTTKTSGGATIDSGTSNAYSVKQIGTADISDNAITSAKIQDGTILKQDVKAGEIIGERGPTGPTGATGATGPSGIANIRVESKGFTTLASACCSTAIASCTSGETLIAGGYKIPDSVITGNNFGVPESGPDGNNWKISYYGTNANGQGTVYAICATLSP